MSPHQRTSGSVAVKSCPIRSGASMGRRPATVVFFQARGWRPRRPAGRLVEWCGLFGVAGGTARVALSRMVEREELTVSDGVYELAGSLRRRQPAQDQAATTTATAHSQGRKQGTMRNPLGRRADFISPAQRPA